MFVFSSQLCHCVLNKGSPHQRQEQDKVAGWESGRVCWRNKKEGGEGGSGHEFASDMSKGKMSMCLCVRCVLAPPTQLTVTSETGLAGS